MKQLSWWISFALVWLGAALPTAVASPASEPGAPGFATTELAPGVFALTRTKPPGYMLDCNVLVVVNESDVLVVDANLTPTSARATIAAIRGLTDKPVRYLVNTHRHADHTTGNQAYREAFPGIEIIGHPEMAADLSAHGQETLDGWIGWAKELTSELPQALASGKGFSGAALDAEQRASYEADLEAARALVADAAEMRVVGPTMTVADRLTLVRGQRTIEIRALGKSHTRGDLVVWLPREGIVATGDLVTAPVPLIGSDQSFVEEWAGSLDALLTLQPKLIVPGHGPVLRDDAYVHLYAEFLRDITRQTKAALARGESEEQAVQSIDVTSYRERMAGESSVLRSLFANWGRVPAVGALYRVAGASAGSPVR